MFFFRLIYYSTLGFMLCKCQISCDCTHEGCPLRLSLGSRTLEGNLGKIHVFILPSQTQGIKHSCLTDCNQRFLLATYEISTS
jgi:hypothetical protein